MAKVPDVAFVAPLIQFGYNELGLRTNMADASGVTTYRYDNRNRLIEKATQGSSTLTTRMPT
jgi:YD repeat-containing protein